jgi:hypothetical protein
MALGTWGELNTFGQTAVTAINTIQYNSLYIVDVKYYDGSTLKDVELQVNGVIVWKV